MATRFKGRIIHYFIGAQKHYGFVSLKTEDGEHQIYFNGRDLQIPKEQLGNKYYLGRGDCVEFELENTSSEEKPFIAVKVIKVAPAEMELGELQSGMISRVLKELNYGFITRKKQVMQKSKDLFFHFSGLVKPNEEIVPGDFVSFRETKDERGVKAVQVGKIVDEDKLKKLEIDFAYKLDKSKNREGEK